MALQMQATVLADLLEVVQEMVDVKKNGLSYEATQAIAFQGIREGISKLVDGEIKALQLQVARLENDVTKGKRRRRLGERRPSASRSVILRQSRPDGNTAPTSGEEVASENSSAAASDAGDDVKGAAERTTE